MAILSTIRGKRRCCKSPGASPSRDRGLCGSMANQLAISYSRSATALNMAAGMASSMIFISCQPRADEASAAGCSNSLWPARPRSASGRSTWKSKRRTNPQRVSIGRQDSRRPAAASCEFICARKPRQTNKATTCHVRHLATCFLRKGLFETVLELAERLATQNPEDVALQAFVAQVLASTPGAKDKTIRKITAIGTGCKLTVTHRGLLEELERHLVESSRV